MVSVTEVLAYKCVIVSGEFKVVYRNVCNKWIWILWFLYSSVFVPTLFCIHTCKFI